MQVGQAIAIGFDCLSRTLRHTLVWVHVQQDGAGVGHEAVCPCCNDDGSDETNNRVHPGESVRLWNFVSRFEVAVLRHRREDLSFTSRTPPTPQLSTDEIAETIAKVV